MAKPDLTDFDPEWYEATYPDVSLTGMPAEIHYRRIGHLLGRPGNARQAAMPASLVSPTRPGPIIDRPEGFPSLAASRRRAALRLDEPLSLLDMVAQSTAPEAKPGSTLAALAAYARLLGIEMPDTLASEPLLPLAGAEGVVEGETRIESATLVGAATLRLRVAGAQPRVDPLCDGWIVSAFQADVDAPDHLLPLGPSITVSGIGPIFGDFDLVHPYMPVILQISDSDGFVRVRALAGFPSLLPGGLHHSELKSMQNAANQVDAFWRMNGGFIGGALAGDGPGKTGLRRVDVDLSRAIGSEPLFSPTLLDWMGAVFGVAVMPVQNPDELTEGRAALHQILVDHARDVEGDGPVLTLAHDSVPTLSALTAPALAEVATHMRPAPFLVAESATLRPRWMVNPPVNAGDSTDLGAGFPTLQLPKGAKAPKGESSRPIPYPMAISFRPPAPPSRARLALTVPPDDPSRETDSQPRATAFDVVIEATDPEALEPLLLDLEGAAKTLVRIAGAPEPIRAVLNRVLGEGGWSEIAPGADLRDLAHSCSAEMVLSISDRVLLHDSAALPTLAAMLADTPDVASASCLLLSETVFKKRRVLNPAVGGVFPNRVSFAAAPSLGFWEPDPYQPLPFATYAVVANTAHFSLWRRDALAALPPLAAPVPQDVADILLGVDLVRAGHRHLCTSTVRAGWKGAYTRRDAVDPIGAPGLSLGGWDSVLERVTVLKELF